MHQDNTVDLGSCRSIKKSSAISRPRPLKKFPVSSWLLLASSVLLPKLLVIKIIPAVSVTVDKDHQVSLEIRVIIYYGMNIPVVARQIQDVIQRAVEDAVDINLKEINVNVQAIERPDLNGRSSNVVADPYSYYILYFHYLDDRHFCHAVCGACA